MAENLYLLSESEIALINEAIRIVGKLKAGAASRDPVDEEVAAQASQAPEMYIALTPSSGIPALAPPVYPGKAYCEVYQVVPLDSVLQLVTMGSHTELVFNLRGSAVPGDTWVLVHRDKAGNWFVSMAGSGGRWVELTEARADKAEYSFREAVWDSDLERMIPVDGGSSGVIGTDGLWEVNRQFGIPVPETYVWLVDEVVGANAYTGTGTGTG